MTYMKRTTTVLTGLLLSVAVLGGTTATAHAAESVNPRDSSHYGDYKECANNDFGVTLLGIPLLGLLIPDKC
ncbi:hypothetical protein [Streptomyces sp. NPDC058371]|uniref:hypothetical protein n=1 Tax=Streptomyces sp. NPDC058371 TaxID=3346463 RepID=UPI0036645859